MKGDLLDTHQDVMEAGVDEGASGINVIVAMFTNH